MATFEETYTMKGCKHILYKYYILYTITNDMNSTITKDTVDGNEIAHHTFTNVEFTAFFNSIFNLEVSSSEPMFLKYYFFIKFGEKVYIEWKYFTPLDI